MKVIRKEQLLNSFPALPDNFSEEMKGKGAKNYVVFLKHSYSDELFARCYHRYSNGHIIERQRYNFVILRGYIRYYKNERLNVTIRDYRIDRKDVENDIKYLIPKEVNFWNMVIKNKEPALILPEI